MVSATILKICENIKISQAKYCVLCLRTESVRNLSYSSYLFKLIEVMNHRTAWSWKKTPFNNEQLQEFRVCCVCEARMATAAKVMDAIKFGMLSSRLIEYYKANDDPHVNSLDHYLVSIAEKKTQHGSVRNKRKQAFNMDLPHPKHPMIHVAVECDALVEQVRKFTTLQATETLLISSGQMEAKLSNPTANTPTTELADPEIEITEHEMKIEDDVTEHGVRVEDDKINDCEVLIENNIELPPSIDFVEVKEETEIFLIDDDDEDESNNTTNIVDIPRNTNDTTETVTTHIPRTFHTLPIQQLINTTPIDGKNIVTPLAVGVNATLTNLKPNTQVDPVFIPDSVDGQQLAIKCPDSTNFMLHQIIAQPDGTLLVPSLPGRIVNGHLEMLAPLPNTVTIKALTQPTMLLNGESMIGGPVVGVDVAQNVPVGLNTSFTPTQPRSVWPNILSKALENKRNPTAQKKFYVGPRTPRPMITGVKRKSVELFDSIKKTVEPPMATQPKITSVQASQSRISSVQSPPQPNTSVTTPQTAMSTTQMSRAKMSSNIDWEDKIPMDVITYMDATDPTQTTPQPEEPMGIISNVYSQKEVDDASKQLESIMQASGDGSDLTCRVISIE